MANVNIKMDVNKALKQASELEEIAKEIENISKNDIEECLNSISGNWTSENAKQYIKKGTKVANKIKSDSVNLKKTVNTIREIIKRDQEAEKNAEKIAKLRTYSN